MAVPKPIETRCRDGSLQARQCIQSNPIPTFFLVHPAAMLHSKREFNMRGFKGVNAALEIIGSPSYTTELLSIIICL